MSRGIPVEIVKEIKEKVFEEADRVNYLSCNTTDNNNFINLLVSMPEVGARLSQYISKTEVRTYIKDGILHRYSEKKASKSRPADLTPIIKKLLGDNIKFTEVESKSPITLFKSPSNRCFIVVVDGTFLKWETALRKALLYIASKSFQNQDSKKVNIILTLFCATSKSVSIESTSIGKSAFHM